MLSADDGLGADIIIAQRNLRPAQRPHHRGAGSAHFDELGLAAFITGTPRRDTAKQPMLFELQLRIESLGGARFFGIDRFGPGIEPAEANVFSADCAPVEPQRRFGQAREEGAVMTDRDESPPVTPQPILKPFNSGEIEMVGRLVEQQDIGVHRQGMRNCGAAALAARCRGGVARQVDADLARDRFDIVQRRRVRAG